MLTARSIPSVCFSCRLNMLASHVRSAPLRSRRLLDAHSSRPSARCTPQSRTFTTTIRLKTETQARTAEDQDQDQADHLPPSNPKLSVEDTVRGARQLFGDALPRGHLNEAEYTVYERLYGAPVFVDKAEDILDMDGEEAEVYEEELPDGSTVLLRETEDGTVEEVDILEEFEEEDEGVAGEEEAVAGEEDVLEKGAMRTEEQWVALREQKEKTYHQDVYNKSRQAQEDERDGPEDVYEPGDEFMRAHPMTLAGRFKPSPSTVFLPKETHIDPVTELLTRANHKHLAESSNRIFGGHGLPRSSSTPAARLAQEQKPISLDPSQTDMGHIESDVYMAAVMPGTYATVMSSLVEVRRRLGTPWIERLLNRKGGPLMLDAGAGGAGAMAWHEVLAAEWERMHEASDDISHGPAPLGKTTVLIGSNTLRHRVSQLMENTTFIPRLPDVDTAVPNLADEEINPTQPRKLYDLIIAPHTLWPLKQEYLRKEQLEKYWSLLNPKGGVLILIEKGLPRGFEVIAAARQHLLDKHISSPGFTDVEAPLEEQVSSPQKDTKSVPKEVGMIIAPCTNHGPCPMYSSPGVSQGRKDFCFFSSRFIRPPYLQRILNAKDRNHEDVQFSYVAVQRGRDQRLALHDPLGKGVVQDVDATDAAFAGHEWKSEEELVTEADVNPLALPRMVLPALKRRGHIVLDVCTPAGTLERWTVPRSFGKQAFRDARKSQWGDLWALGAKTRIPKNVRLGRPRDEFDKKGRRIKAAKKVTIDINMGESGYEGMTAKNDGRYNPDRKIRGSHGRKGRKKQHDIMADLDLD